jgi:esterase/lipase superfamily enzyme
MNREYHRWHSAALDRDMELLVFGHGGARALVFPTSMGRFYQWEDFGMIAALGEHLEQGSLQLYCVDSVDEETWYGRISHPAERVRRHEQYERYLLEEVLPFSKERNENPYLIAAGASFGGFHAVNLAFRHPRVVDRVLGMSGLYDLERFIGGFGDAVYHHNPIAYIANEHDPERLAALRHLDIILAIGRDDPSCSSNESLSSVLWSKDIWHALRIWDGWAHDWPWWRQMVTRYIGGHD